MQWSKYIKIRINIVLRAIFMKGAILDIALTHALWYILFFVIIILIKYYIWVEKIKTKCNVGIHGNIKSWLWVEYIASTGVRIIIIVIVVCWGTYVRIIIIVLCWGTMKNKTYFFNSLSPLYKLRLRILINFALRFSWNCYSTFFFLVQVKKSTDKFISSCLSCFQISFFKGQEMRDFKRPFQNVVFCFCWNCFFLGMNLK